MADPAPPTTAETTRAPDDAGQLAARALDSAQKAVDQLAAGTAPTGANVDLPNFQQVLADVEASGIGLLHDVDLNVKIELGRTNMVVEDVLKLSEGSVVELDKLAGDPVDVYVNDRLVARGEVLVLNDNFCVRISEVIADVPQPAAPEKDKKKIEPAKAGK
jgi:flagellar motor switch protein FliN/FliY